MIVSEKKKHSDVVGKASTPSLSLRRLNLWLLIMFFLIALWFWLDLEFFVVLQNGPSGFSPFLGGYIQTISHWTNRYTLPCCLRLIPQFYFSVFYCYFDLFLLESYFAPCFLLLSPISSLAYFLPLINIFNSWTFLRLMSELAHFHIIPLASWNEI